MELSQAQPRSEGLWCFLVPGAVHRSTVPRRAQHTSLPPRRACRQQLSAGHWTWTLSPHNPRPMGALGSSGRAFLSPLGFRLREDFRDDLGGRSQRHAGSSAGLRISSGLSGTHVARPAQSSHKQLAIVLGLLDAPPCWSEAQQGWVAAQGRPVEPRRKTLDTRGAPASRLVLWPGSSGQAVEVPGLGRSCSASAQGSRSSLHTLLWLGRHRGFYFSYFSSQANDLIVL